MIALNLELCTNNITTTSRLMNVKWNEKIF